MNPNPLVSIIIPTFNRAHLIGETLDSILAQTYINWECIIVDDGSTDNSEFVIFEYVQQDSRFKLYHRPADRIKGANTCRNYGFELSGGEYIKWFDSDDIMHQEFLERQVTVLEENIDLGFCASFSKKIITNIEDSFEFFCPEITSENNAIFNFIIGKLYFLTPSTIWRREILVDKELFDETLFRAQEADFNFRRLIEGNKFCYLEDVLFYVRRGHKSIDSDSVNNPLSLQSQFDYFQKVFNYLNSGINFLDDVKIVQLKKYVIYRLVQFFYTIRLLFNYRECLKNFKIIIKDLFVLRVNFFLFFRIFIGVATILFFKKGYSLIHVKKFDIRDK